MAGMGMGGGGGAMSAAPAAMSTGAAMSGGGMGMSGGGMGGNPLNTGMSVNPRNAPRTRAFDRELAAIRTASSQIANAQADAAIRTNDRFQDSAQESTREIAAELDNDYTRRAQENLTGAQAGVDQVQSAQTGIGQLRDQYAAQGPDPAMQRLNTMAAGDLYRPDQVAADQVSGASVADIGSMQAAPDLRASAAERGLMREARGRGLLGQLEQQAGNELALGRSLSPEQERDATQAARAGMAARGLGAGNSAMAVEMLNRDRFATQRENERRAFASGVLNQGTGIRQTANQAYLTRNESNLARQQAALGASYEAAQQRAMANAGYQQQAALSNQDANLRAQQANQQANQTQEQYNRAFLGQVAGMNFDQNQARTSMLSGLYGQQAGLGQTTASLQQGMAQSQVALDPYQRALGSNMPIATIGPSAGMIGQAYGQTLGYGQDLFNTNLNAQASMYNTGQNNQAALRAAKLGGGSGVSTWGAIAQGVTEGVGNLAASYAKSCWVARAAWGENNPRWVEFRESMFAYAPEWFVRFYLTHGPAIAKHINTPIRRAITRSILTTLQNLWTPKSQLQPA